MKRTCLYIVVLWLCMSVCAQAPIEQFLRQSAVQYANVSVQIRRMSDNKSVESYRPSNLVAPASVMKIIPTATALEHLGGEHRYETLLTYTGSIRDGILHGDLYIEGYGDPTLGGPHWGGDAFLNDWVIAINKAGIHQIDGHIIADCSYYDGDALNPGWIYEDIGNYYAPGIFAIAYMDNTMTIQLQSGAIGSIAHIVKTLPYIPNLQFENHIRCTTINHDGAYVHGLPYRHCRYLTGSIPANQHIFGIKADIPNPGLLLAQHLTSKLRKQHITVTDSATYIAETDGKKRTLLYTHYSPTLSQIVETTNLNSNNLYAEMIFRNLSAAQNTPGTIHHSIEYIQRFWHNRGVDLFTARIIDGCGLAPQNGLSAEHLVNLLTYMAKSPNAGLFMQSLPISGQTGTLKSFLAQTELAGHVHAKSGTIKGTKNYAGYIDLPNGDKLIFAVLVNGSTCSCQQINKAIEKYLLDVYRTNK